MVGPHSLIEPVGARPGVVGEMAIFQQLPAPKVAIDVKSAVLAARVYAALRERFFVGNASRDPAEVDGGEVLAIIRGAIVSYLEEELGRGLKGVQGHYAKYAVPIVGEIRVYTQNSGCERNGGYHPIAACTQVVKLPPWEENQPSTRLLNSSDAAFTAPQCPPLGTSHNTMLARLWRRTISD
jgi:hypothetical protein